MGSYLEASILSSEELRAESVGPITSVDKGGLRLHAILLDEVVESLTDSRLGSRHLKLWGLDGLLGVVESLGNLLLTLIGRGLELVASLTDGALELGARLLNRLLGLGIGLDVYGEVLLGSDIVEVHKVAKGTHVHRRGAMAHATEVLLLHSKVISTAHDY